MDAITAASKMDAKQAGIEMNAIDAQLAGGELTAEEELALRERWAIINSFSDLENRPVEHLADVYHQLKDFVSGARKTWRAQAGGANGERPRQGAIHHCRAADSRLTKDSPA